MKETKHTPGPWRVSHNPEFEKHPAVIRGDEGGFVVMGLNPEREIADAYMIAAAPDLLNVALARRSLRYLDALAPAIHPWEIEKREAAWRRIEEMEAEAIAKAGGTDKPAKKSVMSDEVLR